MHQFFRHSHAHLLTTQTEVTGCRGLPLCQSNSLGACHACAHYGRRHARQDSSFRLSLMNTADTCDVVASQVAVKTLRSLTYSRDLQRYRALMTIAMPSPTSKHAEATWQRPSTTALGGISTAFCKHRHTGDKRHTVNECLTTSQMLLYLLHIPAEDWEGCSKFQARRKLVTVTCAVPQADPAVPDNASHSMHQLPSGATALQSQLLRQAVGTA